MDLEAASEKTIEEELSASWPFPRDLLGRIIYGTYVTALPALAFWGTGILKPDWQSGKLSDYIALLLSPEASLVFLFLLGYSIICYLFLLLAPARFSQLFFIRFGIYTGLLLAFQYSVLAGLFLIKNPSTTVFGLFLLGMFPVVFGRVYGWAIARWTVHDVNRVLYGFVVIVLAIAILALRQSVLYFAIMLITITAPFWSLLLSFRAALWLFRNYETQFTLSRGLGLTVWLATYVIAWRFDILKMYELYAALPKEPPHCYIATAAARGHPHFVHSWTVRCANGSSMQTNAQLQWLKCAELALMAIHPRFHTFLRRIYDVIGERLARRIENPFFADVAYLLLKPCEWSARFILKSIVPEIDSISKKIYM